MGIFEVFQEQQFIDCSVEVEKGSAFGICAAGCSQKRPVATSLIFAPDPEI